MVISRIIDIYRHYNTEFGWFGNKGDDPFRVDIPAGFTVRRLQFDADDNVGWFGILMGRATLTTALQQGTSGPVQGVFSVHWWHNGMADIKYRLRVDVEGPFAIPSQNPDQEEKKTPPPPPWPPSGFGGCVLRADTPNGTFRLGALGQMGVDAFPSDAKLKEVVVNVPPEFADQFGNQGQFLLAHADAFNNARQAVFDDERYSQAFAGMGISGAWEGKLWYGSIPNLYANSAAEVSVLFYWERP